jgi:hypothetical protein
MFRLIVGPSQPDRAVAMLGLRGPRVPKNLGGGKMLHGCRHLGECRKRGPRHGDPHQYKLSVRDGSPGDVGDFPARRSLGDSHVE